MSDVVTPAQVERRLFTLSQELDSSHEALSSAEHRYMAAKTNYEIESAKWRMKIRSTALGAGRKVTVGEVDDETLLRCQEQLIALSTTEAIVKAERANAARIRTQVDIARSIGSSVRKSMEG
jgi:hypothetical protein